MQYHLHEIKKSILLNPLEIIEFEKITLDSKRDEKHVVVIPSLRKTKLEMDGVIFTGHFKLNVSCI